MRLSFQTKLILAFLALLLPLGVIGLHALWSFQQERAALRVLEAHLARRSGFAELENTVYRQVRLLLTYLLTGDPNAKGEFWGWAGVVDQKFADWERGLADPDEARLTEYLKRLYRQFLQAADRVLILYDRGDRAAALRVFQEDMRGMILPEVERTAAEVFRINRVHGFQRAFQEVERVGQRTQAVVAVMVLVSGVTGVLGALLIARSLARPIEELKRAMDVVGGGHLDYRIEVRSRDEVGDLARAFVSMVEKLKEAQARLVQSEKLAFIGQMSAAVAHGLRNPLASIRAVAQLCLYRLSPDDPNRVHLQTIISEVDRLENRIEHLLDFTRPSPHWRALEDVNRIVERALQTISEKVKAQGVSVEADLQADLPTVPVDGVQVEQAILEILANALDAMQGGGALRVTTRRHAEGVEVVIQDTGEGIPPDVLPRVFEPFFTTRADGSGLGLAVAKRFIEQNGGTLSISSEVGRGTTVRIVWPLTPSDPARRAS